MTKPLRHTKHEIKHAAQMAADLGLRVRLEADGAITFIPETNSEKTITLDHGLSLPATNSLSGWLEAQENVGESRGYSQG